MARPILMLFGVLALGLGLAAWADEPAKTETPKTAAPSKDQGEGALQQETLKRQYKEFEQALLVLAQRMAKSSKAEDKEKADNLKKAIEKSAELTIDVKFDQLINVLKSNKIQIRDLKDALEHSDALAQDIQAILDLLLSDNSEEALRKKRKAIEELLKQLDKIIRDQKVVRAQTEAGRTDKDRLEKGQKGVTNDTEKLAKAMGGKDQKDDAKSGKGEPKKPEGKGDSKSDSKSSDAKGDSKAKGQSGEGKGSGSGQPQDSGEEKKGDNQKSPANNNQQPKDSTPGRKQVQDANDYQRQAEEKIKKDDKDEASKKQDKAIDELEKARKKLEELLRQLREEEIERMLAALQQRCERMLQIQIEVRDGTVRVFKQIQDSPDKRPDRSHEQRSLQLSDREGLIVADAEKCIQILEAEGSAVAFPEMFIQVRDDAKHVQRRLSKADVGDVTVAIENDIIASLKEMIEALKKARQANKGSGSGGGGGQQNQRLIDLLAELKMIRAMQYRVNVRTKLYGERYQGEQADEPDIKKELGNLAERQQKIFEVTDNIYRGKNK